MSAILQIIILTPLSMRIPFTVLITIIFLTIPGVGSAQTDIPTDANGQITDETTVDPSLSAADLTTDLAAETLPTTDRFGFWWEQVRHNVTAVFTFNAERKAAHFETRLHSLDRKLAACAETGDDACVSVIEKRIAILEERAEKYMAKQAELRAEHQARFEAWRTERAALIEQRHERAKELQSQQHELRATRQLERAAAQERRQLHRQALQVERKAHQADQRAQRNTVRDIRQTDRDQRHEERPEQRDTSLERRAPINQRLRDTRQRVEDHQAEVEAREAELEDTNTDELR